MAETYTWVRSRRKTVSIQIQEDGKIIVRTPYEVSKKQVEDFLTEKKDWIRKHQNDMKARMQKKHIITEEERRAGVETAMQVFPKRVAYYAGEMGVTYGRITIREQEAVRQPEI